MLEGVEHGHHSLALMMKQCCVPTPHPPQWSDEPCAAHLTQRDGYQAATQGQLKDQLYQQIINYFDKGKVNGAKAHTLLIGMRRVIACSC